MSDDVLAALTEAPKGLLNPSESDEPFEPFLMAGQQIQSRLRDVVIVLAGRIRIDVYLVGRSGSAWAGLKTLSVETSQPPTRPSINAAPVSATSALRLFLATMTAA